VREIPESHLFLGELTRDVVEASRVYPGTAVGNSPTNITGGTLIMPGGRGGYPAFWIRDLAMSLDSGFISPAEALHHLRLVARGQNGPNQRPLKHRLVIPAFAIPDHINFDGTAVFYPGTYSSGEDQGDGTYGQLPPVDDHYEFIHIAWWLWRTTGNTSFLNESIGDFSILRRLVAAFGAPEIDTTTGLVQTSGGRRAVGFGFCDAIHLEGKLLFASLLRYRAAGELSEMLSALGKREQARALDEQRRLISRNIPRVFENEPVSKGWLLAATQVGTQPDVWGTLYALHLGVLKGSDEKRALEAVADAVRQGTITYQGAVRHVPKNFDASPQSAWERTSGVAVNSYQNGAYWHTPTGWLISALRRHDSRLAQAVEDEYIAHLQEQDFRLGASAHAPWECFGPGGYAQNGVYMTSVTVPFAVLSERKITHAPGKGPED